MYNLNDLIFFVQAVDVGSFAAAGRRLGQPKSTVSKRVAELEAALGARLIHRTSRSFVLTETGRDFYDHARAAVIEAEAAETVVRSRMAEPSGVVRITASVPTAQFHLADQLHALARLHPKLELQLHVTDRFVDLIQEGFDIAVRSHYVPLPDSGLMQRQIGIDRLILAASPAYLSEHGGLVEPEALSDHDGLIATVSARSWRA
jgi:DNA-binding transcriptional LysR family regulator